MSEEGERLQMLAILAEAACSVRWSVRWQECAWVRLPSEGFEHFSFACFWWEQLAGRSASLRPAVSNVPNLRTAAVSLRMADETSPAAAAVEVFHAFPALTIKKERKCNSRWIVRA